MSQKKIASGKIVLKKGRSAVVKLAKKLLISL
jgi:hypothetical protein